MNINKKTREWLLDAEEPYVRHNVNFFFNIKTDRSDILNDPFIQENIQLLGNWNNEILQNHSRPQLLIHRLALLADLGVRADDAPMKPIIESILNDFNDEGIPQITITLPKIFGGSGVPEKAWMICDFPVILGALLKMGLKGQKVNNALSRLMDFADENGYRCRTSYPKVKGPGKKTDFCPYVNILGARALSEDPKGIKSRAAKLACETLLFLWQTRGQKRYFLFGIGTDFQKLKYPFVWYNILHMADVLSRYKHVHKDKRFLEMLDVILGKADRDFRFKPESIYMIYKHQDFGNKKEYSRIITLRVLNILRRMGKI